MRRNGMEQPILNLQHLTKSFDGKKILDDLSIDIGRNEFVTLLGPSGCGKTTTLRIIGGFATPDEGKVIFEGQDITNLSPDKRHINTVFQTKFRKKKGGTKVHTLYDVETQIPAFFHITEASVHDSKVMIEIPYEPSSYYIFDRGYNNFKILYKIHQIEAYFVVRAKKNLGYKSIQWKRRLPKNVLSDASVLLTGFYPKQYYPEPLRLVKYWDEEQEREFIFITNAMHISALQVAELYKNRWQVELFFKWLKQHLKIKRFWGTTENAVRIQIYAAICAYCLVAIIQHDMQLNRSTYEVLQILSISLTDKTHLRDLFDKTKFQNDKERFGPNGPSLFNF